MVVGEGRRDLATWRWSEAAARIESSRVEVTQTDQDPYRPVITFRYRADGGERRGETEFGAVPSATAAGTLHSRS